MSGNLEDDDALTDEVRTTGILLLKATLPDGRARSPAVDPSPVGVSGLRRTPQWLVVFGVLGAVVALDQVTKLWGWRHVPRAMINVGSDPLAGSVVGGWYTARVTGALLDVLGSCVLALLLVVLLSGRQHRAVLVSAALMLGGWASNILDRLGLHYWTAPGSARGVVDFIPLGHLRYNVADVCIVTGTLALLSTIAYLIVHRRGRTVIRAAAPRLRSRPGPTVRRIAAAAMLSPVAVVAIGAADDGGVTAPVRTDTSGGTSRE